VGVPVCLKIVSLPPINRVENTNQWMEWGTLCSNKPNGATQGYLVEILLSFDIDNYFLV
jgi:hypothetical protein